MKTTLKTSITVKEICDGFVYNELEGKGLFGLSGKKVEETKLLIYECEGTESEIKEWFKTINIVGLPLNDQELLNAVYSGPFVTLGKEEFSNSQNANNQKWEAYIKGSAARQDFLERALDWVSKGNIGDYMSRHRNEKNITELKTYFNSVIDWVSSIFTDVESEMRGLEWGRLYEEYHKPSQPRSTSATSMPRSHPPRRQSWRKRSTLQTAHSAPWDTTRTKTRYGNWTKWTPTMWRLGARAARHQPRIVRCSAKPTTEQKVIVRNLYENPQHQLNSGCLPQ